MTVKSKIRRTKGMFGANKGIGKFTMKDESDFEGNIINNMKRIAASGKSKIPDPHKYQKELENRWKGAKAKT